MTDPRSLAGVDLDAIKQGLGKREDRGSTHWDGCYVDSKHRDCALRLLVAEVERLRGALFSTEIRRSNAARGYIDGANERDQLRLEVSRLRARLREQEAMAQDIDDLRAALERFGFRRCDIPACNCHGWHGGHSAQRLTEIGDALEAADIDLNGKTILQGVRELAARSPKDLGGEAIPPDPQPRTQNSVLSNWAVGGGSALLPETEK